MTQLNPLFAGFEKEVSDWSEDLKKRVIRLALWCGYSKYSIEIGTLISVINASRDEVRNTVDVWACRDCERISSDNPPEPRYNEGMD